MSLEPAVENCINEHRDRARKRKLKKALFILTAILLIVLILLVASYAIVMASRSENGSTRNSLTMDLTLLAVLLVWTTFLGFAVRYDNRRARADFSKAYGPGPGQQPASLDRWKEGLDAAALRNGVEPPPLAAVQIPSANTLSFEDDVTREPTIGVSVQAIQSQLSYEEIEAIMAHELAHVVTGSYLRVSLMMTWIYWLASFLVTLCVAASFFFLPYTYLSGFIVILFATMLPAMFASMFDDSRDPLEPRKRRGVSLAGRPPEATLDEFKESTYEMDMVADSIAAKIISDPAGLATAIKAMAGLAQQSPDSPVQKEIYDYLFVGPFKAWKPDPVTRGFNRERLEARRADSIDKYVQSRYRLITDRLNNFAEIKAGTWRVFEEVQGGRVATSPSAWE